MLDPLNESVSNAPTSILSAIGLRRNLLWSKRAVGKVMPGSSGHWAVLAHAFPFLIAGLVANTASVSVWPPLSASGRAAGR